jgi:hypothetical protein
MEVNDAQGERSVKYRQHDVMTEREEMHLATTRAGYQGSPLVSGHQADPHWNWIFMSLSNSKNDDNALFIFIHQFAIPRSLFINNIGIAL